jgi:DNA helicase IV
MTLLGAEAHERVTLDHGFRCPPEVVARARAARAGERVEAAPYREISELARWLDDELAVLREHDPTATIAIVARGDERLRALETAMQTPVPFARNGRFPKRGPVFARVEQMRGLEMDVVILPDLDAYDENPTSRRELYVAMTRARHQLATWALSAADLRMRNRDPPFTASQKNA